VNAEEPQKLQRERDIERETQELEAKNILIRAINEPLEKKKER
jgi:hypothetical protein